MKYFYFLLFSFLLLACASKDGSESSKSHDNLSRIKVVSPTDTIKKVTGNYEVSGDLCDVQSINSRIKIELKYTTNDNFVKKVLYKKIDKAYLQKDVAIRLSKCQDYLTSLHPDLYLLVYDAVRPVSVQQIMWTSLDSIPVKRRVKFVSNPKNRSIHNYGAAVDLTICNAAGVPLDMGAKYDEIDSIAYPSLEALFLKRGLLTKEHIANRVILRKVMASQQFTGIASEWWHFNACSRQTAALKYQLMLEE